MQHGETGRWPNLRWKDACNRDKAKAGMKDDTQQTGRHGGRK